MGIAQEGYDNWLAAIDEYGATHGNWWNATVWGECRRHAGEYLAEVAQWLPAVESEASELAGAYTAIGEGLVKAADQEMPAAEKKKLVAKLKRLEYQTVEVIEDLLTAL